MPEHHHHMKQMTNEGKYINQSYFLAIGHIQIHSYIYLYPYGKKKNSL